MFVCMSIILTNLVKIIVGVRFLWWCSRDYIGRICGFLKRRQNFLNLYRLLYIEYAEYFKNFYIWRSRFGQDNIEPKDAI